LEDHCKLPSVFEDRMIRIDLLSFEKDFALKGFEEIGQGL